MWYPPYNSCIVFTRFSNTTFQKNKQAVGRKSADFSPLHYLNTDLKNLYTTLFSVPEVNNMVCLINKDIDMVQMGEVIWNSHEYIQDPKACFQI